jgi:hypothetical protein
VQAPQRTRPFPSAVPAPRPAAGMARNGAVRRPPRRALRTLKALQAEQAAAAAPAPRPEPNEPEPVMEHVPPRATGRRRPARDCRAGAASRTERTRAPREIATKLRAARPNHARPRSARARDALAAERTRRGRGVRVRPCHVSGTDRRPQTARARRAPNEPDRSAAAVGAHSPELTPACTTVTAAEPSGPPTQRPSCPAQARRAADCEGRMDRPKKWQTSGEITINKPRDASACSHPKRRRPAASTRPTP